MRALLIVAALAVSGTAAAMDLFVDAGSGNDANDGLSWGAARRTIGSALASAAASPEADLVSVAAGTYGERIVVPANTSILGGFPAGGGPRDPTVQVTVLDGMLSGAPVVHFPPGSDGTVLDGVTVRGGLAPGITSGGGIFVEDSAPLIENTIVEGNNACLGAGIALAYSVAMPTARIVGCTIRDNVGMGDWQMFECEIGTHSEGGGVHVAAPPGMDLGAFLVDSTVSDNESAREGGIGIHATATIQHCIVTRNRSYGIAVEAGDLSLFDVALTENWFAELYVHCGSSIRLRNVTMAGDRAGGVRGGGTDPGDLAIDDSILWAPAAVNWSCAGTVAVNRAIVMGGFPSGTNVLDADPLFVTGPLGPYYLSQSSAGDPGDSPALDAGSGLAVTAGLDQRTTRRDWVGDAGTVDLGYHYPNVTTLTVLRGPAPDALAPHRSGAALPFIDDTGTLSDPVLPLLFYRVPELAVPIEVDKDLATDAVRIDYRN